MEMEKISKIWWYLGCIRVIWHKKTVILFCCDKWLFMFIITQRTILFELDMNIPSDSQCNTYTAMTTLSHVIQAQYLFETNSNIFVFLLLACVCVCRVCLLFLSFSIYFSLPFPLMYISHVYSKSSYPSSFSLHDAGLFLCVRHALHFSPFLSYQWSILCSYAILLSCILSLPFTHFCVALGFCCIFVYSRSQFHNITEE